MRESNPARKAIRSRQKNQRNKEQDHYKKIETLSRNSPDIRGHMNENQQPLNVSIKNQEHPVGFCYYRSNMKGTSKINNCFNI